MSYLDRPRLHFAGQFQADPSTVNNDPTHFDNATFKPNYQKLGQGATNGWWNPDGSGAWRFVNCRVTAVDLADGSTSRDTSVEPIIGMFLAGADARVGGKIVDLDPLQQTVSEIWGFVVRLTDGHGPDLFRGDFEVAAFCDMWARALQGGGGDMAYGAFYQSVLTNAEWAGAERSPFLQALRAASSGELSIKFNIDGYNMNYGTEEFTLGRIVGTIGPAKANEPRHFVLGRHLMPELDMNPNDQSFGNPVNGVYYFPCVVDAERNKLVADLGNALPTTLPGGPMAPAPGKIELATLTSAGPQSLGEVAYLDPAWYTAAAGIQEFPVNRSLSADELTALGSNPLCLLGNGKILIQENQQGYYLRADTYTFRLNPGERAPLDLYATQFGGPFENAEIDFGYTTGSIGQITPTPQLPVNTPPAALTFPSSISTGAGGKVTVMLTASDPGLPRGYIDGQVYGVSYALKAAQTTTYNADPWDFVSVLVWTLTGFPPQPTWWDNIEPVLKQYANLYPLMSRVVDLGDYDSVVANLAILRFAFSLQKKDPNYMPVTRDLSASKLAMLQAWFKTKGPDGKPLRGVQPNGNGTN